MHERRDPAGSWRQQPTTSASWISAIWLTAVKRQTGGTDTQNTAESHPYRWRSWTGMASGTPAASGTKTRISGGLLGLVKSVPISEILLFNKHPPVFIPLFIFC